MRRRSRARARGLQVLYAWEAQGAPDDVGPILRDLGGDDPFVRQLVEAAITHHGEIDERLAHAMPNWRVERLSAVDRNILRLAIAEILFLETPGPVAIQEAIQLAQRFGTDESPRFVNGVLDAVWKRPPVDGAGPPE